LTGSNSPVDELEEGEEDDETELSDEGEGERLVTEVSDDVLREDEVFGGELK